LALKVFPLDLGGVCVGSARGLVADQVCFLGHTDFHQSQIGAVIALMKIEPQPLDLGT
jgi:hypothetical protein